MSAETITSSETGETPDEYRDEWMKINVEKQIREIFKRALPKWGERVQDIAPDEMEQLTHLLTEDLKEESFQYSPEKLRKEFGEVYVLLLVLRSIRNGAREINFSEFSEAAGYSAGTMHKHLSEIRDIMTRVDYSIKTRKGKLLLHPLSEEHSAQEEPSFVERSRTGKKALPPRSYPTEVRDRVRTLLLQKKLPSESATKIVRVLNERSLQKLLTCLSADSSPSETEVPSVPDNAMPQRPNQLIHILSAKDIPAEAATIIQEGFIHKNHERQALLELLHRDS